MTPRKQKNGNGLTTIKELKEHLQIAIEIEHATIPPYLCALYSIKDGHNQEAAKIIKSVVMEEMLHMVLAANVLNAIGGKPNLDHPRFLRRYPVYMPHSNDAFVISLLKFSRQAIETFMKIERPAKPDAKPQPHRYNTIGQFYESIEEGLKTLCKDDSAYSGNLKRQISPEYFYGGGGEIIPVTNLESALQALQEIVHQGEGIDHKIVDGDHKIFGLEKEYAHYFRFNEIYQGKYYKEDDTPKTGPRGKKILIDWNAVYNLRPGTRRSDYPRGSEIRNKLDHFNRDYMGLLRTLHKAFNGKPTAFLEAVGAMYDLKYKAIDLMKIPTEDGETMVGPSFEFVPIDD